MEELKNVKIDFIKQRDKNYSIMVGDNWYSGFGSCPVKEDEVVDLKWELSKDGKYKNIKDIKTIEVSPELQPETKSRDDLITSQVAFKGSVEIVKALIEKSDKFNMTMEGIMDAVKAYKENFEKLIRG